MSDDNDFAGQLETVFARPSWERRFALDLQDVSPATMATALRLHVQCSHVQWAWQEGAAVFHGFRVRPDSVAVAAVMVGFPHALREASPWFAGVTLEAAAEALSGWLAREAVYPKRPWFDGGEGRGFQAWHVPYLEPGLYGYMVVEPKWFEVHK